MGIPFSSGKSLWPAGSEYQFFLPGRELDQIGGVIIPYIVIGDHLACQQGMQKMKEKYPDLKYRQFPIYYYHADRAKTTALTKNYTDLNVNKYAAKKKSAFQVYYNIHTILNTFYPYSDGLYSIGPERIYYLN